MLETFTDQLKYSYKNATTTITTLTSQWRDLQTVLVSSDQDLTKLKQDLTNAYKNLDYEKTETTLDTYLSAKDKNTYAYTYLVFIKKFLDSYTTLNNYNKVLLDTVINNKEALVKKATIVLPDSGTDLLKKLDLIKTEAEYKSKKPE
jgi:hypothetical protein